MKLITNSVDSAASDLQLIILDAADLADSLATKKSSEMTTEVGKPCVQLMNGQSKNTLKENEKLLTNGFTKNVQVKEVKEKAVAETEEGEKAAKIYNDDIYDDDEFTLELPPPPSEEKEEGEKQKTTEGEKDLTNGDDDKLKECGSKNDGPSIEIVVEERSPVSAPSIVREIEDILGLDDTAIGKDELEKEASSTNDKLDNNTDVDNRNNNTDVVKREEHDDDSQATTFEDSNPTDVVKNVKIENEQVDGKSLNSIEDDSTCSETNLSEVIVSEVIIESDCDNTAFSNNSTVVACKSEPLENTTDVFISDNNETQINDNSVVLVAPNLNLDDESVKRESEQPDIINSSEIDDDVIEDPLEDPLDTSSLSELNSFNLGNCSNSIINDSEKIIKENQNESEKEIKDGDGKESKITKKKEECSEISKTNESLSKQKDEEAAEQDGNEEEEITLDDDNEVSEGNPMITENQRGSITAGIQNSVESLGKEEHIASRFVEGTSRKRSVSVVDTDDDDDDGAYSKRIRLFDESSSDSDSLLTRNSGLYDLDAVTSAVAGTTTNSEKRSTEDELGSDDIKRIRLNNEMLSTCELQGKSININSGKTVVESNRLDEDVNYKLKEIGSENSLVSCIKKEEEDAVEEASSAEGIVTPVLLSTVNPVLIGTVTSALIGTTEVKCERIESGEEVKTEVVYDLVAYKNTNAETSITNVEKVRIKVEREYDSVKEADKTNKTAVTSESRNDISNKNSEPKITSNKNMEPNITSSKNVEPDITSDKNAEQNITSSKPAEPKITSKKNVEPNITTNKESKLAGKKPSSPKKTVSRDENGKTNKKIVRGEDDGNKKTTSNLDAAMERVVQGAKANPDKKLPLLIRFHKDQLRKLTRTDLEELIVQKLCEAITDRSAIGELRLRCQNLEQINDQWRKKAIQLEKQNRELEMVLKKYLTESANNKRDRHPIPVKVTRSVGLQVILSSAVYGTLENARLKAAENLARDRQQLQNRQTQGQQKQQSIVRNNQNNASQVQKKVLNPEVIDLTDKEGERSKQDQQKQTPQQKQAPQPKQVPQQQPQPQKQTQQVQPPTPPPQPQQQLQQQQQKVQQQQKAQQIKQQQNIQGRNATVPNGVRIVQPHQISANSPQQLRPPMSQNVGSRPPPPPPAINISNNTVLLRGGQPIRVQTPPAVVKTSPPAYVGNTPPRATLQPVRVQTPVMKPQQPQHPAPLPPTPHYTCKPGAKLPPPKPQLKISKTTNGSGIQLSWSMNLAKDNADIASYQLYAYQEGPCPPNTNLWKKVGDVKALPLPMACTLTQFVEGNKYHFAVRAVDTLSRCGPFSLPGSILLAK